jgi:hypothetical protein
LPKMRRNVQIIPCFNVENTLEARAAFKTCR